MGLLVESSLLGASLSITTGLKLEIRVGDEEEGCTEGILCGDEVGSLEEGLLLGASLSITTGLRIGDPEGLFVTGLALGSFDGASVLSTTQVNPLLVGLTVGNAVSSLFSSTLISSSSGMDVLGILIEK